MAGQGDVLFGRLAVEKMFCSEEQVREALAAQSEGNGSPRLGDILIERGYLSPAQRERVLAAQEAEAFNETNGLFGHLAVKNGLARQEHVDECLALQKRMFPAKKAATPHLGELLVERGYMSAPDSRAVLRAQERLAAKRAEASRAALLGKPRPQRTEGAGTSGVRMARPVPKPDEVQRMSATGFFEAPTGVPREDREDRRFSRLAVERGLVTKEQVEQVCVIQRGLLAKGKNVRFGVLCTAKGLLSLDQVKSLMAEVTAAEASAIASSSALGLVGASSAAATRHAPDAAGSADATVISPPPAPPPVPGAPAGGAITCVFCGAGYPLNGRAPGDVFSCSGCGAQITVPGAGAPATPTLPALEEKMALAAGTEADDDDFGGNFDNDSARWMKVDLSEKAEVPPPLPGEGSGGNGAKKASISADGTVVTMPPEAVEEKWEDFDDAGGDTVAAPVADGAPVTGSSSNATVVLGDPAESGASAGSTVVAGLGGSAVTILFDTPGTVAGPDGQRTVATAGAGGTAAVAVAPEKKKPEIFIPRAPKDGKRIGEYTILRELGRGAMGVVYEAVQEGLGRRVALKILPANLSTNEKIIERFRREAASVAKLKHEHIIPVYGMGEEEGTHYFAMEFVDGRSLEDVISKERLDLKTGVQMMIQAADALAYAHGKGVVHRDIKPANLMVTWAENKVMVADFGLAREEEQASMTRSGQIMGSPAYMPPEQAMGSKGLVGPWSDQYSLGTTMYELFTLTRAFPGEDIHEVIRDVIEKEPVPPRRANEKVPRDLETIILKAMEKVKEKRYVDCGVLAQDLRAFLEGDPISAKPITFAERIYRKLKKHKAITAISTAAVLVLGSGGAYVWVSARNQALEVRREVNKLLADAGDCVATHARLQQEMEANKAAWDFPQKINAAEDQAAALNDAKTALTTAAGKEKDNEEVKRQADYVRDEIIRVDTNLNSLKEQLAKARDEREQRAKSNAFVSEAEKSLAVDTLDDVEKARNLVRNALVVWAENPKALTLREQVETRYKALEEESRLKEARAKAKARYDAGLIPFASAKESLDHGEPSLAEAAEINNNFRTAVSEFDVALSIFPRDIDAGERMYLCHYLRAQMYSRLHRFDLADEMVLSADSTLRKIDNLREEVNKAAVEAKPGEPEAAKPRSEAEKAKAEEEGAFRDQLNALAERMRGEIAQLKETVQRDRNYNEIYKAALDEAKDMEAKGNWDAGRHALTRARKVAAKEDVAAIDRQARSIEKSEKEREAEIAEKTADWDKAAGLYRKAKGFV
ncbi:MAG: protein kinase, partial [Planctomycetes bacterium]|nr:protein kinase [Planctomycetota bacterium]